MAAPVINEVRPYTGYKRNEPFQFTLAATPQPLRWGAYAMPPGITVDDPADYACTGVEATDVLTATGNTFANGDAVYFSALTGGDGLAVNTQYFVRDKASDTFKLAAIKGGAAINFTTDISAAVIRKVSTGVFSSAGIAINTQYLLNVWGQNGDGIGTAVIPVCISPELYVAPADGSIEEVGLPLTIDSVTRAVRVGKPGEAATTTGTASEVTPLFTFTQGDTRFFVIYFERSGVQIDPDPTDLAMALKEVELDPTLVEAPSLKRRAAEARRDSISRST